VGIVTNMNFAASESVVIGLDTARRSCVDALAGHPMPVRDGALHLTLRPGQCVLFEF
jgi:hypothetical protein